MSLALSRTKVLAVLATFLAAIVGGLVICCQDPVIEFHIDGQLYVAKVIGRRPASTAPNSRTTHHLRYITGGEGTEWVDLDVSRRVLQDEYGHAGVLYKFRRGFA